MKPSNSIYYKALKNKKLAAYILLPLIEFEFAFHGSQKPAITQSERNLEQLRVLYKICSKHRWISSDITKLGNKNEYWFKLSNQGFQEIYKIAGPLADKTKDKWARLLVERSNAYLNKDRLLRKKILNVISKKKELTTMEFCLEFRRLPYTITRHLRKLENQGLIKKTKKGWMFISAGVSANSPS